jgi:hypothetical protein
MTEKPSTLRAHLDRLSELTDLALSAPPEDRARVERSIQLVSQALQMIAWARQHSLDEAHQKEAAEVAALCRRIVEVARAAGLRIEDNYSVRKRPFP